MEQLQPIRMLWQKRADGSAALLRFYGASAQVHLPPRIEGRPLTEIAPYCFAGKQRDPGGDIGETILGNPSELPYLRELRTDAVEEVFLPDSVKRIGRYAFYNCKKLHTIHIGAALRDIGSDAFMNTLSFHRIILRCKAGEASGIRQILAQISSDIEVCFWAGKAPEAVLLYPEYYESYDEVAPAHLFGRSISGEGFRARQCIRDGRVDFAGYDAVFPQACVEEREETLARMAQNRLRYPYALSNQNREIYSAYVRAHIRQIAARFTERKDLEALEFLREQRLLSGAVCAECVKAAAGLDWPEGAASLLGWIAAEKTEKKKRYDFDF